MCVTHLQNVKQEREKKVKGNRKNEGINRKEKERRREKDQRDENTEETMQNDTDTGKANSLALSS